jgi:drug/metabolite transporter (DMT)-like permease
MPALRPTGLATFVQIRHGAASMPSAQQQLLIRAAPLTFALLWSSGFIVARMGAVDAEPFTFLTARFALAVVLLLLLALATRAPWPRSLADAGHNMAAGMLLHGGYLCGVWWAVAHGLPAGLSALITAAQPLLTAILAAPLAGERVSPLQWAGIVVGFVGIILVLAPRLSGIDPAMLGVVLIPMLVNFGATISVTLGTFYQKRFAASSDLRTGTCLQFVGALIIVVPLALATEELRFAVTANSVFVLLWSVVALSIGAIALLLLLIRRGAVSRVAALIYLVPPLVAIEAFVLFGEDLTLVQMAGMAATAAGVWLAVKR